MNERDAAVDVLLGGRTAGSFKVRGSDGAEIGRAVLMLHDVRVLGDRREGHPKQDRYEEDAHRSLPIDLRVAVRRLSPKSARVKGSNDNVVRWNPRLRSVWNAALELRADILSKRSRPIPIRAEQRFVFVNQSGERLSRSALNPAWQDFTPMAIKANVITPEQRFTLHGLKLRGVTDTQGNKAVKKQASGHKTDAAFAVYDHEVAVVEPAVAPEFSGVAQKTSKPKT